MKLLELNHVMTKTSLQKTNKDASIAGLNSSMEGIERINELEDSMLGITQCKQTIENRLKKEIGRDSLRYLWEHNK